MKRRKWKPEQKALPVARSVPGQRCENARRKALVGEFAPGRRVRPGAQKSEEVLG